MHSKKNRIKEALANKECAFGAWVQMASSEVVEAMAYQGYDFLLIDMEHGQFGYDQLRYLIQAADAAQITAIVRVPNSYESTILKVMDMGIVGIVVPNVNTKEEASRAIRAGKYSPQGMRGACPWTRAAEYNSLDWSEHMKWTREQTTVWLTIETKEGVDNADEILSVSDIDGVMIGAFDMAQSLNIPGEITNPLVTERVNKVAQKVVSKNIPLVGALFADPEGLPGAIKTWQDRGSRIMIIGGDRGILCRGARELVTIAHKTVK